MPRKAKDKEELIEDKKVKKASTAKKATTSKKSTTKKATKSTTTKKVTKVATKKEPVKKAASKKIETKKDSKKIDNKKTAIKKVSEKKPAKKATKAEKVAKATKTTKVTATKAKKETKTTKAKAAKTTAKPKKEVAKKVTTKAKTTSTKKAAATTKKTASKKAVTKKTAAKKVTAKTKKVEIVEYYDLPYRYNKTIVKVLAQTPDILFVYWDISDEDKQNYINQYGEFFFNDTKPVLIVYNDTMKYSYEVDINDYANSWYLHIKDSNCDYRVELGRRPINEFAKIDDFLSITSSNEMDAPNDHILFDSLNKFVYFRNVKTNLDIKKDISLSFLTKIGKIYNIKEFYKKLYKDENIDFEKLNLKNMPSS